MGAAGTCPNLSHLRALGEPHGRDATPPCAASLTPKRVVASSFWGPPWPRWCGRTSTSLRTFTSGERNFPYGLGHFVLSMDLRAWVNSGLMSFFFLVVGLEARREVDIGEFRERRGPCSQCWLGLGG